MSDLLQQSLNDIIDRVITPDNVRLGHTWLKRQLREAIGDASLRKDEAIAAVIPDSVSMGAPTPSPDFRSEISVSKIFETDRKLYHSQWSDDDMPITPQEDDAYKAGWEDGWNSRSLKPVSISHIANAAYIATAHDIDDLKAIIKFAYENAGVAYHD